MIVSFNEVEVEFIKKLAHVRNDPKYLVKNHKVDESRNDYAIHCQGVAGELAVSKALSIPIDTRAILHGDGGVVDLILPDKRTIQVKFRNFRKSLQIPLNKGEQDKSKEVFLYWNHLAIKQDRSYRCVCCERWCRKGEVLLADIGVMVMPHEPGKSVEIAGFITREDFIKKHCVQDFGYGKRYAVSHKDLSPIELLIVDDF